MTPPGSDYRRRIVDEELDDLMSGLTAVSLEGAKGVGKTATARQRAATVHRLDLPADLEVARAHPERLLTGRAPVLIDEWQYLPEVWSLVRRQVDDDPRPGRFLLTGSASPTGAPTHSGAARIVPVRMRPLSLAERGYEPSVSLGRLLAGTSPVIEGTTDMTVVEYVDEILRGGFPGLRHLPDRARRAALDGYLSRVVDREFPEQGLAIRHPDSLRAWMRAYAAATATTASFEAIRDAATPGLANKPAKTTTGPWRDVLTRLWLLDPVPAWLPSGSHLSRLGRAEKHNVADPALAARLLGVGSDHLLRTVPGGGPPAPTGGLLGPLFESLVLLSLRVYAQAVEAEVRHLRTHRGEREIDAIVCAPDGGVVAVEVKLAARVSDADVRHLHWLAREAGPLVRDLVVVTTGREAYRRADGVAVVPAALLGP